MYIAYNNSDKKIIAIREVEWQCRMNAKDIDLVAYNTWVASITDSEGVVTYPSETFTIVKHDFLRSGRVDTGQSSENWVSPWP